MMKNHMVTALGTAILVTSLATPAQAQPESTLSDMYGKVSGTAVEFSPISDDARTKIFDRVPEEVTTTRTEQVTITPTPVTTQRTVTVAPPEDVNSVSGNDLDDIILPPEWEGFVDEIGTAAQQSSAQISSTLGQIAPKYDSERAQKIIDYAYSQLGVPYLWGGTSSGVGLDCSGLTQNAYAAAGISIPRVTYDQVKSGPQVSVNDIQPGDLIFYNVSHRGPEHVALAISSTQVIHAPQTGDVVKIDNINMMPITAVVRPVG